MHDDLEPSIKFTSCCIWQTLFYGQFSQLWKQISGCWNHHHIFFFLTYFQHHVSVNSHVSHNFCMWCLLLINSKVKTIDSLMFQCQCFVAKKIQYLIRTRKVCEDGAASLQVHPIWRKGENYLFKHNVRSEKGWNLSFLFCSILNM